MSQINVNVVAPLGYTGPALVGNNNNVQTIDSSGSRISYVDRSLGYVGIGGLNPAIPVSGTMFSINIGLAAGQNLTGQLNGHGIAIGSFAMQNSTFTGGNIAIGQESLKNVTGLGPTVGINNTAVGTNAGVNMTSGYNNVLLGAFAGFSPVALTTGYNNIVIGAGAATATATTNNSITLGNSANDVLRCAVTSITSLSDARDKKDVAPIELGIDFVKELNPVKFVWDDRNEDGKHDIADSGFIAQELKAVEDKYDAADVLKLVYDENPEKLEASYGRLIPVLVQAIKDLAAKVEELENK
jgi:trimeric autotransporter adhesin